MKAVSKIEIKVDLTLEENEALLLMSMVQNPVCDLEDEPADVAKFRERLFNALKEALPK